MKHPARSGTRSLLQEAAAIGVQIGHDQALLLDRFEQMLLERAIPLGLVASGDARRIRRRHVLDSLRATLAVDVEVEDAYDLGSGAGLPGLVVAIARPDIHFALVEPRRRRIAFLESAVESLGVGNAEVLAARAEELDKPVDLCLARAFGSVDRTWRVASPLLRPGGSLVYFAGEGFDPAQVPEGAAARLLAGPVLESAGPLVIMTQQ
ncbi:MAG: 16S rRNA (guanine(527)-N(7))-methyltransferase RsmG [Actinomycetota bacterium]